MKFGKPAAVAHADFRFGDLIVDMKLPLVPPEIARRQERCYRAVIAADAVENLWMPWTDQGPMWRMALEVAYAVDEALDEVLGVTPVRESECGHLQPPPAQSDEHGAILTRVCETCGLSLWWQVDRWREL